jgi:hypothetical protein
MRFPLIIETDDCAGYFLQRDQSSLLRSVEGHMALALLCFAVVLAEKIMRVDALLDLDHCLDRTSLSLSGMQLNY